MLPHASLADIPSDVQALILARLDDVARAERVRIVLAVELGVAGLGVCFDVIERPIEGELDLNGWDLRKALTLGLRWNPALVEWLTSPIVYRAALLSQRAPLSSGMTQVCCCICGDTAIAGDEGG